VLQLSSQITTIKFENLKADVHKDSMRLPLLKVVFEAIDKDKSGTISYDELASFGQVLNLFEILKFLSF
jgi:Ca2+-binding EF-hand superfamily protein